MITNYWDESLIIDGSIGDVVVKALYPRNREFKPVVLVHGWAATSDIWFFVSMRLREFGFPVYVIDLPGHGASSHPENVKYDLELMHEYLHELINKIGEPVILAGHSMGGAISMGYTLKYPRDISSLVLVSTAAKFWEIVPESIAHIFPEKLLDFSRETTIKFYSHRWNWKPFLEKKKQTMLLENSFNTHLHVIKSTYEHIILKWDKRSEVSRIKQKTLMFVGSNDMITPKRGMEFLLQEIPFSVLKIYKGVSHQLPIEKGDALAQMLYFYARGL